MSRAWPARPAGGFTLMEALAAVITLGLLAAAMVPMLRQLNRTSLGERMQAQASLRTLTSDDPAGILAIAGHPGWRLVCSDLIAGAEPAPPPGCPPPAGPPHHWRLVSIHAESNGEILAETVVAALDPAVTP